MVYEKIVKRRTIRKFQKKDIPKDILTKCVDAARLSPSGANLQPLKYVVISEQPLLTEMFGTLRWSGYLPDHNPSLEEMPRAQIVILLDTTIQKSAGHNAGIAAMSISMVGYEAGLGSCILGAIDRDKIRSILQIPEHFDILLVIALGYPAEKSIAEKMKDDSIKYWLDKDGVIHVPKRTLEDIVKWNSSF
ncbi:MAG: nitroreductase family protein [Candidatus Hodarchaeota archaeon]